MRPLFEASPNIRLFPSRAIDLNLGPFIFKYEGELSSAMKRFPLSLRHSTFPFLSISCNILKPKKLLLIITGFLGSAREIIAEGSYSKETMSNLSSFAKTP